MRRIFLVTFALLLASTLHAQQGEEHLSAFAHGAGGTYSVTSRGLDAIGLNPALLGIDMPKPFEISVFPVSSFGVDAGPSFSQINTVSGAFNGTKINDTSLRTVGDLLFSNQLAGRADG